MGLGSRQSQGRSRRRGGGSRRRPVTTRLGAAALLGVFLAVSVPALPADSAGASGHPRETWWTGSGQEEQREWGLAPSFSLKLSSSSPVAAGQEERKGQEQEVTEILGKLQDSLQQVRDLHQIVRMEIVQPASGSVTQAEGRLRAILPHLFRLDFLAPSMLAGVSVLVDLAANEVRQFQPVTEQVIVQAWDRVARERSLELELSHWLGAPDPERFHLERGADYRVDGTRYVVLKGTAKEQSAAARYEFFIHPERWWVEGLRLYDANDALIFSAWMTEITFNQGMDETALRSLPADAEIVHR